MVDPGVTSMNVQTWSGGPIALGVTEWAVPVRHPGQTVEELLDGGGHSETGGSDDGHSGVGHAFDQVAGEVAVAAVPDPLTVGLVESGPPLVGEL
jgi:hypothetical protein